MAVPDQKLICQRRTDHPCMGHACPVIVLQDLRGLWVARKLLGYRIDNVGLLPFSDRKLKIQCLVGGYIVLDARRISIVRSTRRSVNPKTAGIYAVSE